MIRICNATLSSTSLIVGDPLAKLVVLLFQLIAFETGQRPQTHVDDRSGLHFRQLEPVYQCDLGFVGLCELRMIWITSSI